ncbi:unnamed protein product [Penicillium salamii]|uniref:Uncharacterized protein n=1 Tax=Penicillium salamii TaxID=1612424 RepID=A0A9W4JKN4_9EURO|nr:unnamed protein product [Penicillium salamii]CAG8049336.1 unnamed protein product [Penicillium salamii]CAG8149382.1 unnamed protein product [Penicillium salamii]CAG8319697.1 unnamed protein product [Penicillium salamii]CAG8356825.1 unnamed protein product [Penicillium salamii]
MDTENTGIGGGCRCRVGDESSGRLDDRDNRNGRGVDSGGSVGDVDGCCVSWHNGSGSGSGNDGGNRDIGGSLRGGGWGRRQDHNRRLRAGLASVVIVHTCTSVEGWAIGDACVETAAGSEVVARVGAAGAAVGGVHTCTGVEGWSVRNACVDAGAGSEIVVAVLVGRVRVIDDVVDWEAGHLRGSEDGGRAESEEEAQEAGEVDSSGDHCCGRCSCVKKNVVNVLGRMNPKIE